MKRHWHDEELTERWSLSFDELTELAERTYPNRLGFAVLLKFLQVEGRFPDRAADVPPSVVAYLAEQIGVSPRVLADYDLQGRTARRNREKARILSGFRPFALADDDALITWLKAQVPLLTKEGQLRETALAWCLRQQLEPPAAARLDRLIASAVRVYEQDFFAAIVARLSVTTKASLDALLDSPPEGEVSMNQPAGFSDLAADPGRYSLDSVLKELAKLQRIEDVGLPVNLFREVPPTALAKYRSRAATEPLRELRRHPEPVRHTLLAVFCQQRRKEIVDGLVELLIGIVHKIGVRAERKVVQILLQDFRRVRGKDTLLYRLAEAALAKPDGVVREVLYPIASEQTLVELVREYKSSGPAYKRQIQAVMHASYGSHYRRMLPLILDALDFRSNNVLHRPVVQALKVLLGLRDSKKRYLSLTEVPLDGVVRPSQQDLTLELDSQGQERVNRIHYEIHVLQALREGLRCKEIWVEGAERYRNPDEDLPSDFEVQREHYYELLQQPLAAEQFVSDLKQRMTDALKTFSDGLVKNSAAVTLKGTGKKRILLSPLEPLPEPVNLLELKTEVVRRWPMTNLLDVLKEVDLRIGFTDEFKSIAQREMMPKPERQKRLLLSLFGLGTNTGLKRISACEEGVGYEELLYIRRRYITKQALRQAIAKIVNATLAARRPDIWGEGTTACASDSKKFGAWDQNLMTEWHIRYGGRGVMIYWHVEKNACCIYSQLKRCSSSEVAAMIEGVLRHCTEMEVQKNYVDSHGQSEVAFAFCHLLGFELLPRLKGIARQKLYTPEAGSAKMYPNLEAILTRPINWELIERQYDEMVKFATALRLGTAETEAILRRFTRSNVQHPTYRALAELGKAVKTIFLCTYLHHEALRREVHEGLNVIETWNSINSFIFYGKAGEVATNRLEDQETSVLSLHLLQMCLVYINTLMLQQVLAEGAWLERMRAEDLRALSPLMYTHVNPYGSFELDLSKRLDLAA